MRNLIFAIGVCALTLFGCSAKEEPAVAATEDAVANIDATETADATDSETPAPVAEKQVSAAVEESSGDVAPEEPGSHDLRLASSGGNKQPPAKSRFKKGVHYREMMPAQPKVSGSDKIEVVEVFWYGCGHCFQFDPYIKNWSAGVPADVEFVRLPAVWNDTLKRHAKLFYTADVLARSGALERADAFHDAVFQEIHVNRKPLNSDRSIKAMFDRFGVSGEDYDKAASSFEVDQKLRAASDLTRRYGVTGVPMLVVNGRYASKSDNIKGFDDYLALIDDLVALER